MANISAKSLRRWGHVVLTGTIADLRQGKYGGPGWYHATRRNIPEFVSEELSGELYYPAANPFHVSNVLDLELSMDEEHLAGFLPGRIAQRIFGGSVELTGPGSEKLGLAGMGIGGIDAVLTLVEISYEKILGRELHGRISRVKEVYAKSYPDVGIPWIMRISHEKLSKLEVANAIAVIQKREFNLNAGTLVELQLQGRFKLQDFEIFADPDPMDLIFG